jgi:thiol-disulfide isomerase/thioredoxin
LSLILNGMGRKVIFLSAAVVVCCAFTGSLDDFRRERGGKNDAAKNAYEGKAPPAMESMKWANWSVKPPSWAAFKGKVVVLDFWTFWCGPCKASMPHMNEMYAKYKEQGFILVGVHSAKETEEGEKIAREYALTYPIAYDPDQKLFRAFGCDSYPDYVVIDRKGVVRMVDLANQEVERAVEALLKEKA